jgi:hypothetical protein
VPDAGNKNSGVGVTNQGIARGRISDPYNILGIQHFICIKIDSNQYVIEGENTLFRRNFLTGTLLALGVMCSLTAAASDSDNSPLEVGIFPPLQYPSTSFGVTGLRLSVVGVSREARGLDLALLGHATDLMFKGLAISGLFNYNQNASYIYGLQVAGLANINRGQNAVYGLQLALYNSAGSVYGLQLGLINVAEVLHGVQIGLFNINKAGPFHASPIINAAF